MPEYLSPGVYMEEVDKGPKPIEGVGTAMPVFIGFTERAEEPASGDRDARKFANKPELVTSWKQYNDKFGSYVAGAYLPQSVEGYFINGGSRCYVLSVRQLPPAGTRLTNGSGKDGLIVRATQASIPGKPVRVRVVAPSTNGKSAKDNGADATSDKGPDTTNGNGPDVTSGNGPDATDTSGPDTTAGNSADAVSSDSSFLKNKGNSKGKVSPTPNATGAGQASGGENSPPTNTGAGQPSDGGSNPTPPSGGNPTPPAGGVGAAGDSGNKAALSHFRLVVEQQDVAPDTYKTLEIRDYKIEERLDGKFDAKMVFSDEWPKQVVRVQVPEKFEGKLEDLMAVLQVRTLKPLNLDDAEISRLSGPAQAAEFKGKFDEDRRELVGMQAIQNTDDITMVVVPDLMTVIPETPSKADLDKMTPEEKQKLAEDKKQALTTIISVQTTMIDLCSQMKDRVAILDTPPGMVPTEVRDWRMNITGFDSSYAAMYYPWIEVMDPITNRKKFMPPSGHMAGVWARSDNTRGVHKAPANEVVRGAEGLAYYLTKGEHDILNPVNLNCIRQFPGMGYRVWGARTLSSISSWKYLNIRRLFNYVEKSIERGTQWVVFEPNEPRTWARLTRDVRAFLLGVWRNGALYGLSPEEAFYVKCDEDLNPSESRREGKLIIEIGMAPVYPAEFVIFRISQWAGPGEDEA